MKYIELALLLLRLANLIIDWARKQKYITEGYDKAIAEQTAAILKKTDHANKVMSDITRLNEDDVDSLLHTLEPK